DRPDRPQWMIAPNPDLKVHVAEKFASSIVAAAHSPPPNPFGASESLLRSGGEGLFQQPAILGCERSSQIARAL
ncbi:hypothetical protein, partial [Mesorhizobium sp. M1023]|uniref:hypothetical protein n=1 Tax=Mesorhizobium sp. M1023 TaxID=2957049 RepID=UPI0033360CCC